jgi:hypothetical protein
MTCKTILLLIRRPDQIGDCLSYFDLLHRPASKIQVVVLGAGTDSSLQDNAACLARFRKAGIECYTDTPGGVGAGRFQVVSRKEIAALLAGADVVIPL